MKKYLIIILVLMIGILAGYYLLNHQNQRNVSQDPLNLFGKPNPALDECLKKVNSSDPLGLNNETELQKKQRQDCINKYQE